MKKIYFFLIINNIFIFWLFFSEFTFTKILSKRFSASEFLSEVVNKSFKNVLNETASNLSFNEFYSVVSESSFSIGTFYEGGEFQTFLKYEENKYNYKENYIYYVISSSNIPQSNVFTYKSLPPYQYNIEYFKITKNSIEKISVIPNVVLIYIPTKRKNEKNI